MTTPQLTARDELILILRNNYEDIEACLEAADFLEADAREIERLTKERDEATPPRSTASSDAPSSPECP